MAKDLTIEDVVDALEAVAGHEVHLLGGRLARGVDGGWRLVAVGTDTWPEVGVASLQEALAEAKRRDMLATPRPHPRASS